MLVHECSWQHYSQKMEITQMSISDKMDKQNVVYSHKGMWFSHRKTWSTKPCYDTMTWMTLEKAMLSRRIQTQKVTYCMIPFECNTQNRWIHRDGTQDFPGAGERKELLIQSFLLRWGKCFRTGERWQWHNLVDVLKVAELYIEYENGYFCVMWILPI